MDWSKAGVLGVAVVLLLAGGIRVAQSGGDGWAFLSAGFLVAGAWLTVALHDKFGDEWRQKKTDDEGGDK